MEPFDYPDNDSGPQSLFTTIDRTVQWAKTVEARGFVLAPITVAIKPKSR